MSPVFYFSIWSLKITTRDTVINVLCLLDKSVCFKRNLIVGYQKMSWAKQPFEFDLKKIKWASVIKKYACFMHFKWTGHICIQLKSILHESFFLPRHLEMFGIHPVNVKVTFLKKVKHSSKALFHMIWCLGNGLKSQQNYNNAMKFDSIGQTFSI